MLLSAFLLLLPQQIGHDRYVIDPAGEIMESAWFDSNANGSTDLWLAVKEDGHRFIQCYQQGKQGGFPADPTVNFRLSPAVVAWAVGNFSDAVDFPGADLIYTTRNAVYLQPFTGKRPKKIHEAEMLLDLPSSDFAPLWREVADMDGDGLDEILLPTREGFLVLRGDGTLVGEIPISLTDARPPVASAVLSEGVTAKLESQDLSDLFIPNVELGIVNRPPVLHSEQLLPIPSFVDLNGDRLLDISWYRDRSLHQHFFSKNAGVTAEAQQVRNIPPESGRREKHLEWVQAGGGPAADLLVMRVSKGLQLTSDWQIRLYFDAAQRAPDAAPDFFRKVEGTLVVPYFEDLNGDGRKDVGLASWGSSGLLSLSEPHITFDFLVYLADQEGGFSKRAHIPLSVDYPLSDLKTFSLAPAISLDLDGDGMLDLLRSSGKGTIEVLPFEKSETLSLGKKSLEIPADVLGSVVEVKDLNADGVGDILVRRLDSWEIFLTFRR